MDVGVRMHIGPTGLPQPYTAYPPMKLLTILHKKMQERKPTFTGVCVVYDDTLLSKARDCVFAFAGVIHMYVMKMIVKGSIHVCIYNVQGHTLTHEFTYATETVTERLQKAHNLTNNAHP